MPVDIKSHVHCQKGLFTYATVYVKEYDSLFIQFDRDTFNSTVRSHNWSLIYRWDYG